MLIAATSEANIFALTIAGALAGALGLGTSSFGISFSGAGTGSGNSIATSTSATVGPSSVLTSTAGRIDVSAANSSTIEAQGVAGSLAFQSQEGASLAVGVSIAENQITRNVRSTINNASVTAQNGWMSHRKRPPCCEASLSARRSA